jgi:hypothetical protein
MSTTVRRIIIGASTFAALAAAPVQAAILRASAGIGDNGSPTMEVGLGPGGAFLIGYRFTLDRVSQVEEVGGLMIGPSGTLFAAIVSLSGPDALPSGDPFDSTTIASTLFALPDIGPVDMRVPLLATLNPGSYALILGSGYFGADGRTWMPVINPNGVDDESFVAYGIFDIPWRTPRMAGRPGWSWRVS